MGGQPDTQRTFELADDGGERLHIARPDAAECGIDPCALVVGG
jgi:hypothetical protein